MMSLVSFLSRIACARRPAKSHSQQPLWKWVKSALWLEPLENRSLPSTAVFTTTFSGFTTYTDQPLAPSIPQFDTMGGQRILESVEIISNIELDSSVSGTVTNHSRTAATEEATVTNASISVTGIGFTSPLMATQAALLDTGPLNCPGRTTTTIGPFSASLPNSSDVTLTGGALAPFIGTGTVSYTTSSSADSTDHVTGGSNLAKNTTVSTNGTATVEIIYTFVNNPALVTTAGQAITLGTTAPTLSDSATLSGAANPSGTITFTLTGPGGFSFTHTDTIHGNGTYTAGPTLPTSGLVAGTYTWSAHYSGDANNNSANDQGGTAEQTIVSSARTTLVTTAESAITLGTTAPTLSDSAVLSGGFFETGTITFVLTGPGGFSCTHTDTLDGSGTYTASDTRPASGLVAGTYTWSAHYSGNANNNIANDQGGTDEQTIVSPAQPSLVTTAQSALTPGMTAPTLSDSAMLSGGFFETGTITFTLTGPGGFSYTQTDTVHGNGTYTAADTVPTTGLVAGTYKWSAHYSGDTTNNSANDQGGTAEQTVVNIESDVGGPRLTIDKIGGETVHSGDTVDFTIVVSNQGATTAQNVLLSDPLPDATHLTWTTDAGTITNGVLTDNIGSLSSGGSVTIHVSAVTPAGYSGTLSNTATATSTNNTPQTISASATDIVVTPSLSSISGLVFVDSDKDGNFVPGDIELPGVTITLTGVTSGGTSVVASVVTDVNGDYAFAGLQPGTYNLVETQPENFIPGANFSGDLGGTPGLDVISSITVQASQAGVNYRFTQLALTPGAISKQQLLSSSTIEQLTGPAGTGVTTVTNPVGPGAGLAGPHSDTHRDRRAFAPNYNSGVNVAAIHANGDGPADIVISGATASAEVRVQSGFNTALLTDLLAEDHIEVGTSPQIITAGGSTALVQVLNPSTHSVLDSFFAAPSQVTGVYVGGT
jgi:uncharacterized repeat protein (TIGR01451 family)